MSPKVLALANACPRCGVDEGFNKSPGFGGVQCNNCKHIWLNGSNLVNERTEWLAAMEAGETSDIVAESMRVMMKELVNESQWALLKKLAKTVQDQADAISKEATKMLKDGSYRTHHAEYRNLTERQTQLNWVLVIFAEQFEVLKTGEVID